MTITNGVFEENWKSNKDGQCVSISIYIYEKLEEREIQRCDFFKQPADFEHVFYLPLDIIYLI